MSVRRFMFQVHMWIGLILGMLFAALGLSGSALVYDDGLANLIVPPPHAVAQGPILPLDRIASAARETAGRGPMQILLPQEPGDAVIVRVGQMSRMENPPGEARRPGRGRGEDRGQGERRGGLQVFIDPASGAVLGSRNSVLPPILVFAHQLHGNFFMGRGGRSFVGWLGVGMLILGVTGLVLWWPKRGQWTNAFLIRRTARGLRFQRELHAATGIWFFILFMLVSFSGVAIAFPQTIHALIAPGAPAPQPDFSQRDGPAVEPVPGATRIGPDAAALLAQKAVPGGHVRSVTLPARRGQAIAVAMSSSADTNATVFVDPYRSTVLAVRDPINAGGADGFMAWQRPLHEGLGLGPVFRVLVFLVGFTPALFLVTGVIMWLQKRKRHVAMNAPLAPEMAS